MMMGVSNGRRRERVSMGVTIGMGVSEGVEITGDRSPMQINNGRKLWVWAMSVDVDVDMGVGARSYGRGRRCMRGRRNNWR